MRKITHEEWTARSKESHGDKYDYSRVSFRSISDKVEIGCPEHGWFKQQASRHMRGSGCTKCGYASTGNKLRSNKDTFIENSIKVHGPIYDYSKVVYKDWCTNVEIGCPEHGFFWQAPNNHTKGQGCPTCGREKVRLARTLPFHTVLEEFREVHGDKYQYVEGSYTSSHTPMTIICSTHGEFSQRPSDHKSGQGCPDCHWEAIGKWNGMSQEEWVRRSTKVHNNRYDYSRVIYTNRDGKVEIGCPVHGFFWQQAGSHVNGHGCASCGGTGPSKGQLEIAEFLSQHTEVVLEHGLDGKIGRRRIDIFLPEFNIGVEYHGLIWHSSRYMQGAKDFDKHKDCAAHGVRLIHIYDDEWQNNRGVVERLLLSAMGKLTRVFARKCKVVEVGSLGANAFYKANHMQGSRTNKVNIGLEYEGRLVACMGFNVLTSVRGNKDTSHWELTRYASAVTVVGGASRLLKSFLDMGLAHTITSYVDVRLFEGGMYEKLGFTKTHVTPPDYSYTTGSNEIGRRHKSGFQKSRLARMFPGVDLTKTEREITEENGWYRIYDCGKIRYDLKIK